MSRHEQTPWRRVLGFVSAPIAYPRWLVTLIAVAAVWDNPVWVAVGVIIALNLNSLIVDFSARHSAVKRSPT